MSEVLQIDKVEHILTENWQRFIAWQKESGAKKTLAIPEDILPVLIPRRIFELAHDPDSVRILLDRSAHGETHPDDNISVIIYEKFPTPVSDKDALTAWVEKFELDDRQQFPMEASQAVTGVDYKHMRYYPRVRDGKLTLNDKILVGFIAGIDEEKESVAITRLFDDRREMQRQGIGTSFFTRWEAVLKQLGFTYLLENVVSEHPQFFTKIGRVSYERVPLAEQLLLPASDKIQMLGQHVLVKKL